MTQRIEVANPISSGNQFSLAGFTGETYGTKVVSPQSVVKS